MIIESTMEAKAGVEKRKEVRERSGLKFETVDKVPGVAQMLGVSVDYLKKIERNGRCSYKIAKRLGFIYNCDMWIFLLK